jgi:hypothetical protein
LGSEHKNPKSADILFDLLDRLLNKSHSVERLCITIDGTSVDEVKGTSFISSVLKHKVDDFSLSLADDIDASFVLPHNFLASKSLNKLHLDLSLTLNIHSGICFSSLYTLILSNVTFENEKSVQQLFSGCTVLQELSLVDCYWGNIKQINVSISTLRKLTIDLYPGCHFTVTIDVGNPLSLRCTTR